MGSSGLIFFISPILLHLVRITQAQPDFQRHVCSDSGNYSSNSTYQANLNRLLSNLSSNTEIDYGFYNFSAGQNTDKVYAIATCRGDIKPDICRSCVNDSSHMLPQVCPYQKEAIGWYEFCMLRYSNRSIFGTKEDDPEFILMNSVAISETYVVQFKQELGNLLTNLTSAAAADDSPPKFASGEVNFNSFQTIYAYAQCTPDLSKIDCSNCLEGSKAQLPVCCAGKQGARILKPSCNLHYELYTFINPAADAPPSNNTPTTKADAPPTENTTITTGNNKSTTSRTVVIIVALSVTSLIVIVTSICIFLRLIRKPKEKIETPDESISVASLQFDFHVIRVATANFSNANKLGQGGFGAVYKGVLSNGLEIAVKRLSMGSGQGDQEFKNEILLVAKLQHRSLARLLGFCLEGSEMLLIYEFVPNGSLDHFIFDPTKRADLDWERRYKIIGGIARGLLYLHEDSRLRIVHRDLKASNILLDAEMNPKISDFGMARLFVMDQTQGDTSRIVGTYGYMAPEYAMHGNFSVKSDVFSFGVLVLEIVSGQKNNCFCNGENVEDLIGYAWKNWRDGKALDLMDPTLRAGSRTEIMRCIHIGLLCVQENVADRPTMASVVLMLSSYSLTLPVPSKPPFFVHSNMETEMSLLIEDNSGVTSDQSQIKSAQFSVNECSMSEMYPR